MTTTKTQRIGDIEKIRGCELEEGMWLLFCGQFCRVTHVSAGHAELTVKFPPPGCSLTFRADEEITIRRVLSSEVRESRSGSYAIKNKGIRGWLVDRV